mgnify:FL=1
MIRYFTAGETHGPVLTAIIEGMPAGVYVSADRINAQLALRQRGFGRGGRMKIETDKVEILSGVRAGFTTGAPVTLAIKNRDFENWRHITGAYAVSDERRVICPRPGHADLAGAMKYAHTDMRNVLERASARETAVRVAAGALIRAVGEMFGMEFFSRVVSIADVADEDAVHDADFYARVYESDVGFGSESSAKKAREAITAAGKSGKTLGGVVEVTVRGVVPGLGSYAQYDRKLDARLAGALMSIQAIKGVEIGLGFKAAQSIGGAALDEIFYDGKYRRKTNNAGGIEGGMSNGEDIVVRAAMKPIPTQTSPLESVDITTKKTADAASERSDVCAVAACACVAENVAAVEIVNAFLEKFGADTAEDIRASFDAYKKRLESF